VSDTDFEMPAWGCVTIVAALIFAIAAYNIAALFVGK
jgi:hypothetical protein